MQPQTDPCPQPGPFQATPPVRLGIIGFGRLARTYYLPALRRLRGIQVIAVADPLEGSRSAAKAQIRNVTAYSHHRDLLDREALDAVLVASPPSTHLQIWNESSKIRVPVFIEKPFLLNGELARMETPAQPCSLLMIDFNRRFWPEYQRLGRLARSDRIGKPESAQFLLHVDVLRWCSVTPHRLSPSEGGALYDLGSQELELVRETFGESPVSILAETWSKRWQADHVRLLLNFKSGLTVQCELGYSTRNRERIVILGSKGRLRLDDPNGTVHLETEASAGRMLIDRCKDGLLFGYRAVRRDRSMMRYTIHAALDAFLCSVRANSPFSPGFEDAARNARWLEAAMRSAAERRPVSLDTLPEAS